MKARALILIAISLAAACTKQQFENETAGRPEQSEAVLTKSYLVDDESSFRFLWLDSDVINYVAAREGTPFQDGTATLHKTVEEANLEVSGLQNLQAGDVMLAYYTPSETSMSGTIATMSIPEEQYSVIAEDSYRDVESFRFTLNSISLDKTSSSSTSSSNYSSRTPDSRTLSFTITNYKPSTSYLCKVGSGEAVKLSPSSNGKCSVTVPFESVSFSSSSNSYYGIFGGRSQSSASTETLVSVFSEGCADTPATVSVKATGSKTSTSILFYKTYTYSFSYNCGKAGYGEAKQEVIVRTGERLRNLRAAMPMVASPYTLTEDKLSANALQSDDLYFYMLGSLVEFRIYSLDAEIGVSETIKSATLVSDGDAISGGFSYDLTDSSYGISGLSSHSVTTHVEDLGYTVPYQKDNYVSIYMVVAPGTFSGSLQVLTDSYQYDIPMSLKTYSRATKKPIALNLASDKFTRTALDNPGGGDVEEPQAQYAVFGSDRHSNFNYNGNTSLSFAGPGSWMESILSNINTTLGYDVSFVGYGGDQVGELGKGSSKPAYNTSSVVSEVTAVYPDATVMLLYAAHDSAVTDDAGVLYTTCQAIDCGGYYVYALPQDYMSSTSTASTAATEFTNWAATVDASKPIVILSHLPTIKKRGDNSGATAWHRAMNTVATGSSSGTAAIRNVLFFCGHNHSVDETEYYYAPGSSMSVQGTTGSTKIYYTYSVAGYIAVNGNATLMTLDDDTIVLEKFTPDGPVSGTRHEIARLK